MLQMECFCSFPEFLKLMVFHMVANNFLYITMEVRRLIYINPPECWYKEGGGGLNWKIMVRR